jgi:hypothetical protein
VQVVQIAIDIADLFSDAVERPPFDRSAEIDADQLAEHPGIDALSIIMRKSHEWSFQVKSSELSGRQALTPALRATPLPLQERGRNDQFLVISEWIQL